MALLEFSFQSDVLGFEQQLYAILPDPRVLKIEEKGCADPSDLTVLYLLHAYHGNASDWFRCTMLSRFLEESRKKIAVIMPAGLTYWYTDMVRGWKWYTYVAEEVPMIARSYLHISSRRENTYVAGMSMGGQGAVKLALRHPERYCMAASFSGSLDPATRSNEPGMTSQRIEEFANIYGEDPAARFGTDDDLMALLEKAKQPGAEMPKLYLSCGTADGLYPYNIKFRDKAVSLGYDVEFYEEEGVGHEWKFWNREVEKLIDRIPAEPV